MKLTLLPKWEENEKKRMNRFPTDRIRRVDISTLFVKG